MKLPQSFFNFGVIYMSIIFARQLLLAVSMMVDY